MTASPFELRIAAAWQRLDELLQDAGGQSDRQALLNQAIAELGTALEELRVSAEELQQQNDDLADARNAIEAERTRYSDLFEFAPDAYVVTDANAVIEEANAAAERLLHRDRQFLAGKPLVVFVDNGSRAQFRERLRRLGNGEVARVEDWEVRLHPQPADPLLAALTVAPVVSESQRITGFRWLIRDISERKRTEEALRAHEAQLRQTQKLEAVGRLAGGVAHDINNQLTVIKGAVQFVVGKLPADHPCRRDIDRIGSTVERSAALVRQLLTFSRSQPLDTVPLNLARVLQEMTQLLRLLLGEQITLEVRLAPDLWLVRADRGAVEQVVMNLVANARDAIAPNGGPQSGDSVRVEVENFDARSANPAELPPGTYVRLTVSDDGPGMSPEVQEHIFEPFFTTKEPGKGTGLGLATALGVVQQHHGHITCATEVGRGSTFKVYLPRDDSQPSETVAVEAPSLGAAPAGVPGATILLVEDEPNVREVVERTLRETGYRVYTASNAAEALQVAAVETPINLLVTDVVVPSLSGPMLAQQLVRTCPDLAVIFMSGYAPDAIALDTLPGKRFLSKPFDLEELLDAVAELLQPRP